MGLVLFLACNNNVARSICAAGSDQRNSMPRPSARTDRLIGGVGDKIYARGRRAAGAAAQARQDGAERRAPAALGGETAQGQEGDVAAGAARLQPPGREIGEAGVERRLGREGRGGGGEGRGFAQDRPQSLGLGARAGVGRAGWRRRSGAFGHRRACGARSREMQN